MSNPDHQFPLSTRLLRCSFAFACAASLLLGSSTKADTVLVFGQYNPADKITATESGGVTTLSTAGYADGNNTSIPVQITIYNDQLQAPFPILGYEYFVPGTVHSVGAANGSISQNFVGTIQFWNLPFGFGGNSLLLQAVFSGPQAQLAGGPGSGSATLNAGGGGETVTFSNDPGYNWSNASFGLSFSSVTPVLSTTGGSISSFQAVGSGTFSASVVPEPGTLGMGSIAIVIGTLVYRRKAKAKAKK